MGRAKDRVLILGGTSGIGEATHRYIEDGYHDDFPRDVFSYGQPLFDILNSDQLGMAIRTTRPTHVVYSIGVNRLDWLSSIQSKDFHHLMDVNVAGFISTMQALRELCSWQVSVVAVTSDAAWRPMRTSMVYCASKAALEMCVKVASRELASVGWRVNAVAPGKVADTPMSEYVDQRVLELRGWSEGKARDYEAQSSALGRSLSKSEVAGVIASVLLSRSQGWTGAVIPVNGGR